MMESVAENLKVNPLSIHLDFYILYMPIDNTPSLHLLLILALQMDVAKRDRCCNARRDDTIAE